MRELIADVPLWNRIEGRFETGQLFQNIDDQHLRDFEQHWRPEFMARLGLLPTGAPPDPSENLGDAHWDWRGLIERYNSRIDYESFAIECAGRTQGLLLAATVAYGRAESQRAREIVYVDRLATAPWNRHRFRDPPVYKGVGRTLLTASISLSLDLGFQGRIGLHALRDAESWYANQCGMLDLGQDTAYQNLRYFEMTEAIATTYLT